MTRFYLNFYLNCRIVFRIGVVFFALSFIGLNFSPHTEAKALEFYETLGGDFSLTGKDGKKVNLNDYRGKVVLMTFGYTYCPDVCPTILSHLKILLRQLGDSASQVQVLFVTVDPERDNPDHLYEYVSYFHPSFVGLTGSEEEIAKVAKLYGAAYVKQEVESMSGYFFAHSDTIYLIDPEGRIRGLFNPRTPFQKLSEGVKQLLP